MSSTTFSASETLQILQDMRNSALKNGATGITRVDSKAQTEQWHVQRRMKAVQAQARPTCTHITMRRTFSRSCQVCPNMFPQEVIGMSMLPWVYVCDADHVRGGDHSSVPTDPAQERSPPSQECDSNPQIARLQSIGLSKPIIRLAKQDFYTKEQLEMIIAQRLHVKETIEAETRIYNKSSPITKASAAISQLPANLRGPFPTTFICTQTGCPRCRPHFRERASVSFGAVFAGEIPPVLPGELSDLHIADAAIVRKMGARVQKAQIVQTNSSSCSDVDYGSSSRSSTTIHTSSDEGLEMKEHVRHNHTFYGLRRTFTNSTEATTPEHTGASASLKGRYERLKRRWWRKHNRGSSPDVSRVTLPLSGTGVLRSFTEHAQEFDLFHLRRKPIGTGFKARLGMTASLNTVRRDSFSPVGIPVKEVEQEHNGSEISVDGGVALTEEAVEMHTPDIITQI